MVSCLNQSGNQRKTTIGLQSDLFSVGLLMEEIHQDSSGLILLEVVDALMESGTISTNLSKVGQKWFVNSNQDTIGNT